jgi:hypothetical protein
MTSRCKRGSDDLRAGRGSRPVRAALAQLRTAYDCSRVADRDLWEFAVEMESLLALGLTTSELRLLVYQGLVEHAQEITEPGDAARRFVRCCNLDFPPRTRFVLAQPARSARDGDGNEGTVPLLPRLALIGSGASGAVARRSPRPRWDSTCRLLHFGSQIVKRYRQPAPNQERVLAAFEEEGWPPRIFDPLPPRGDQAPTRRLQDVIRFLNSNQQNSLILFLGDGTGQGVLWQTAAAKGSAAAPGRPRLRAVG